MRSDAQLKLLTDIKDAIYSIDEHLSGKRDFEAYLNNKTVGVRLKESWK